MAKSKPQGKLNYHTILKGILSGVKHYEIAEQAGSLAKSKKAKCNAIKQAVESNRYKKMSKTFLEKLNKEIERLIDAIAESKLQGVAYDKKASSLEKLEKMHARLSGGVTERIEFDVQEVKEFLSKS